MSEITNHAQAGPAISEGVMDEYMLGGGPPQMNARDYQVTRHA